MNFYIGLIFLLQLPVHTASSFKISQRSNPLLTCLKTSSSPIHPTLLLDSRSLTRNKLLLLITWSPFHISPSKTYQVLQILYMLNVRILFQNGLLMECVSNFFQLSNQFQQSSLTSWMHLRIFGFPLFSYNCPITTMKQIYLVFMLCLNWIQTSCLHISIHVHKSFRKLVLAKVFFKPFYLITQFLHNVDNYTVPI